MQNFLQTLTNPVTKFEHQFWLFCHENPKVKSSAVEIDILLINPTPLHLETESSESVERLCYSQKLPQVNTSIDHLLYFLLIKINYLVENQKNNTNVYSPLISFHSVKEKTRKACM